MMTTLKHESINQVLDKYSKRRVKVFLKEMAEEDGQKTLLIEGDRTAFEFLSRLLLAASEADDCGFQISPSGPGSVFFAADSTHGFYLHRLPCQDDEEPKSAKHLLRRRKGKKG